MGDGDPRRKVAVLGGGVAAMTAAFELTDPARGVPCDVTVYQRGWRLGGKGASGRNAAYGNRIEEHGLHVWFGFYDNAFRVMRRAYEELGRPRARRWPRSKGVPALRRVVLYDLDGPAPCPLSFTWPHRAGHPGDTAYEVDTLPSIWDMVREACDWLRDEWSWLKAAGLVPAFAPFPLPLHLLGFDAALAPPPDALQEAIEHRLTLACGMFDAFGSTPALDGAADFLGDARDAVWGQLVGAVDANGLGTLPDHARVRLFLALLDITASAVRGIVADGILIHGWNVIDDKDLCEWLADHGAKNETVRLDDPAQRTPALRSIYDLAFGYRGGVMADADISAGTAMSNLLKLAFGYHGSLYYKMAAGMGDTVFGPFYEVLKARGVKFAFFHHVEQLDLSPDGQHVDAIQLIRQAELAPGHDHYDPLVPVAGLPCWPSLPRADQLVDPAAVGAAGTAFEREPDPLGTDVHLTLHRTPAGGADPDFDDVVLAISVAALPGLCPALEAQNGPYKEMLGASVTVATQAFQLWMTEKALDLGWPFGPWSVAGAYLEPLDTYADMSHLLPVETWSPADRVRSIAYFCGVMRNPVPGGAPLRACTTGRWRSSTRTSRRSGPRRSRRQAWRHRRSAGTCWRAPPPSSRARRPSSPRRPTRRASTPRPTRTSATATSSRPRARSTSACAPTIRRRQPVARRRLDPQRGRRRLRRGGGPRGCRPRGRSPGRRGPSPARSRCG